MVGDTEVEEGWTVLLLRHWYVRVLRVLPLPRERWRGSEVTAKQVQAERLPLLKGDGGEATCVDANPWAQVCVCVCVCVPLSCAWRRASRCKLLLVLLLRNQGSVCSSLLCT